MYCVQNHRYWENQGLRGKIDPWKKLEANNVLTLSLRDSVTRFFASDFFHELSSPKSLKITLGSFQIFSKIHRDIRKSRCIVANSPQVLTTPAAKLLLISTTPAANLPPLSTTPAANFATSSPGVVDTVGKFATCVNDTCSKFSTSVNDVGGILPPVSTTPVANLQPVPTMGTISDCCWQLKVSLKEKMYLYANSTTQRCPKKIKKTFLIEDFFHLVNDTSGEPLAVNISANFQQNLKQS